MKYLTPEWIAEQRQISEIVDMACEYAPGSVVPLLKQIEKSQFKTAALDALEATSEEIKRLTAERDAAVNDLREYAPFAATCKKYAVHQCGYQCQSPRCLGWEWRGPCAENATEVENHEKVE